MLTCTLTSALAREIGDKEDEERGFLAGTFFSIGPLLLAYYFPQLYDSASKRAERMNTTLTKSVGETIGVEPVALSLGIIDALAIPEYYRELLTQTFSFYIEEENAEGFEISPLAKALGCARLLAEAIVDNTDETVMIQAISDIIAKAEIEKGREK